MARLFFILIVFPVATFVSQAARAPMMTVPALGKSSANIEAVYMLNGDVITGKFVKFDPKLASYGKRPISNRHCRLTQKQLTVSPSLEFTLLTPLKARF